MHPALLPLLDAGAWMLARMPKPAVLATGRALATLARPLLRSRRRIAAINIGLCFPELDADSRRRLADASVVDTMIGVLESVRSWRAPSSALAPLAQVEGIEHLRAALARGGVVLLGGHSTPLEMGIRLVGEALGRPPVVMLRRHNDPCLEGWIDRSRRRHWASDTLGKKEVGALLDALRAGEPVIWVADQDANRRHAFVPFFGVPAATLTVLPDFLRQTGASMLPFWIRREDDGRYRLRIGPAWSDWPSGDAAADAARYNAELEAAILEAPSQYLWAHKRFKTRPPGEPPVY